MIDPERVDVISRLEFVRGEILKVRNRTIGEFVTVPELDEILLILDDNISVQRTKFNLEVTPVEEVVPPVLGLNAVGRRR